MAGLGEEWQNQVNALSCCNYTHYVPVYAISFESKNSKSDLWIQSAEMDKLTTKLIFKLCNLENVLYKMLKLLCDYMMQLTKYSLWEAFHWFFLNKALLVLGFCANEHTFTI